MSVSIFRNSRERNSLALLHLMLPTILARSSVFEAATHRLEAGQELVRLLVCLRLVLQQLAELVPRVIVDDDKDPLEAVDVRCGERADDVHVQEVATMGGLVEFALVREALGVGGYAVVAVGQFTQ